jgi:hypothetical protein
MGTRGRNCSHLHGLRMWREDSVALVRDVILATVSDYTSYARSPKAHIYFLAFYPDASDLHGSMQLHEHGGVFGLN